MRIIAAAHHGFAGVVIIRDQGDTRFLGFFGLMGEEDQRARHIIEQRVEMIVEQRQPMFHALMLAARAHRFIKRIVIRGPERRHIAAAEAADGFGIERGFAGGQQFDFGNGARRQLGFGIEATDGIEVFAEKIQPQRLFRAGWPEIDDAAAQREIARFAHGAGARITILRQKRDELVAIHAFAGLREEAGGCNRIFRRHALKGCVHRGHHDGGFALLGAAGECGQSCQPPAFDIRLGGNAVIGQAIPAGERQHGEFGIEEAQRLFHGSRMNTIGRDENHKPLAATRSLGGQIGIIAFRCAGDREAAFGARDVVQTFQVGFLREQSAFIWANTALSWAGGTGALSRNQS